MLTIKNNNLYYYNYKIFNGELSPILIPLIFILIFYYNNYIKYFSLIFLLIGIIGTIDSYIKSKIYNLQLIFYAGILMHIIGFFPLTNIKKYFEYNNIIYFIGSLALLIIIFLPYWTYHVSRKEIILILLILYIFYILYHLINK